jgi:hypothetical protein
MVTLGNPCDSAEPTPIPRRFPPPWTIEDKASCFIVKENNGHALA